MDEIRKTIEEMKQIQQRGTNTRENQIRILEIKSQKVKYKVQ